MAAKTMDQQEICHGCTQKSKCQEVYEKMGNIQGGSIVSKVITAFLLPILVFIASLAGLDKIFREVTKIKELQTVTCFLLALLITCMFVLIIRLISRGLIKHK